MLSEHPCLHTGVTEGAQPAGTGPLSDAQQGPKNVCKRQEEPGCKPG